MGQSNSTLKSANLYEKIQTELTELITKFKPWTEQSICDQFVVVYKNQLSQLNTNELANLSVSIGIKFPDQPENKDEMCNAIVNHYLIRTGLLNEIYSELKRSYESITSCIGGPICLNVNEVVTDMVECQKIKGIWIDKEVYHNIVKELKHHDKYHIWMKYVNSLDHVWGKYLRKIHHVINLIKTNKDTTNDNIFNELKVYAHEIIRKMKNVTKIYCLIVANFHK